MACICGGSVKGPARGAHVVSSSFKFFDGNFEDVLLRLDELIRNRDNEINDIYYLYDLTTEISDD